MGDCDKLLDVINDANDWESDDESLIVFPLTQKDVDKIVRHSSNVLSKAQEDIKDYNRNRPDDALLYCFDMKSMAVMLWRKYVRALKELHYYCEEHDLIRRKMIDNLYAEEYLEIAIYMIRERGKDFQYAYECAWDMLESLYQSDESAIAYSIRQALYEEE